MTTDSAGRFSFTNLNAGSYRLSVTARGYVAQEYGQTSNTPGGPISLRPGEALKDATIRLTPTGAISGRVLDETGQPATGASVRVLQTSYTPQGKTYQVAATASADDRGEYRLYGIIPGRYYLSVGEPPSPSARRSTTSSNAGDYAFQLYPGVSEVDQAVLVEVGPGPAEITIDIKAQRARSYVVVGSIIDSATGRSPTRVSITLASRTPFGNPGSYPVRKYDRETGRFEAENVLPGSYIIQAQIQTTDNAALAAGEAAWATFPTARVPITVVDKDLNDIVLILKKPASVSGRVRVEGQTTAPQGRVYLTPTDGIGRMPPARVVGPDGAFQLIGLWEGEYSVGLQGYPEGLNIKSIRFDGTDILTQPFRFSGSGGGMIDILLHPAVAQLAGTVMNAIFQPVAGAHVVLLPDQRGRTDLYRLTRSDKDGHFSFSNLTPGDYKLFAWETMEGLAYYDPEFVQRFEQQGNRIHVAESSNSNADVRIIPVR